MYMYLFGKVLVLTQEVADARLIKSVVYMQPLRHLSSSCSEQPLLLQEVYTFLWLPVEPVVTISISYIQPAPEDIFILILVMRPILILDTCQFWI